ncbi:MAG: hypothetical protein IPG23_05685 [Burkholderiales bacterium]|nr:hypothetical protein [Burkholderiales bacterium]
MALAVLLAGCVVAGVGRKWGVLGWAVVSVLLAVAPLMPWALIGSLAEDRFFVVLWVVVVVNLGVCLAALLRLGVPPWLGYGAMALLAVAAWGRSAEVLKKLDQAMAVYQAHGDAVRHGTARDIVSVSDRLLPHFLPGMLDLRSVAGLVTDGPAVVSDEVELAAMALEGRRLLSYDNATKAMFDASEQSASLLADWRKRLSDVPFQARITYNGQAKTLDWAIDAPGATKYFHIAGGARTEIPPKFAIRVETRPEPCFWIRIDGPGPIIRYTGLMGLPTTPDRPSVEVVWEQHASLLPEKVQCERMK